MLILNSGILDIVTLILHEPRQNVPAPGDTFGSTAIVLPVPRTENQFALQNLAVTTETTLRIDSPQNPCLAKDDSNDTLLDCIDNVFEEKEECYLPWRLNNGVKRLRVEPCSESELLTYKNYMTEMMGMATIENLHRAIGCTLSCNQTVS